jgi:hypothetical protein
MKKLLILLVFTLPPLLALGSTDCKTYLYVLHDNDPQTLMFDVPQAKLMGPYPQGKYLTIHFTTQNPDPVKREHSVRVDRIVDNYYPGPGADTSFAADYVYPSFMPKFYEAKPYPFPAHFAFVFSKVSLLKDFTPVAVVKVCFWDNTAK